MPTVERARDRNFLGGRMSKLEANGHKPGTGILANIMIAVVFHKVIYRDGRLPTLGRVFHCPMPQCAGCPRWRHGVLPYLRHALSFHGF